MGVDDIKNGQRINCNGVHGIVIGTRRTRSRRFVLAKMDNGFTLKLNALSVGLSETSPTSHQKPPANFSLSSSAAGVVSVLAEA